MKENSKYSEYRFLGKISTDEILPWYDFVTGKPWDDPEIPWVLDNKVRRQILIFLSNGSKTFEEIYQNLNFIPHPLLINEEEYKTKVKYQWTDQTLENHLLNLEWYNLIRKSENKYEILFPILGLEKLKDLDQIISSIAYKWLDVLKDVNDKIKNNLERIKIQKLDLSRILIEKIVEKLYENLKKENIIPDIPNIKSLWAEQLRNVKFEEWIKNNF